MSKHKKPRKKHLVPVLTTVALTGMALSLAGGPASADNVTIRTADFITSLSATRANGTVTVGDNGIGVVTETPAVPTSPSPDKAAEYWKAELPLADAGEPTLTWKGTTTRPGKQLYVDLDGDASTGMAGNDGYKGADGILVGEMYTGTDGKPSWWMNNASTQAAKDAAPQKPNGGNTPWQGTLDEWRTAFPDAKVVATGFSLGSGAGNASGIITQVTVGETTYSFAGKDAPVVQPPAPVDYSEAVKVTKVQFNPAGDESKAPNGEYVQIKNRIAHDLVMTGYKLVDAGSNSYSFPNGFTLKAGATVTVYMGKGTNTATKLYRGKTNILNNEGDAALVKRPNGSVADACAYNKLVPVAKTC